MNVPELLKRTKQRLSQMSAKDFANFFSVLHKKKQGRTFDDKSSSREQVLSILNAAQSGLSEFDAISLARIVHAVSKLGLPKKQLIPFARQWVAVASKKLSEFEPQSLSLSIYGLAKMSIGYRELGSKHFFREWAEQCVPKFPAFQEQHLANSLYAVGQLRLRAADIGMQWFRAWSRESAPRLPHFNEQQLSNCIYALGVLGDNLAGDAWLQAWSKASRSRMAYFAPQGYANSILALAKLRVTPTELRGLQWYRLWARESQKKFKLFTDQNLSNSMYALGVLQVRHSEVGSKWFKGWSETSRGRLERWNEQNLANSIYGIALVDAKKVVGIEWFKEFARVANFAHFTDQALANTIHALGEMRIGARQLDKKVFEKWAAEAAKRQRSFTEQALSNSLYAVGKLELKEVVGEQFVVAFAREVHSRFAKMHFQGLSNVLSAMEMMALGVDELGPLWFQDWIQAAARALPQFQEKNLSRALTDLSRLGVTLEFMGTSFVQQWARAALEVEFDPRRLVFVLQALHKLGVTSKVLWKDRLGAQLAAHFRATLRRHPDVSSRYASLIEPALVMLQ